MAAPRFYFVRQNGKESGPYSVVQLAEQWKAGSITAAAEIRQDGGSGKWHPIREFSRQLERGGKADRPQRTARVKFRGPGGCTWILIIAAGIIVAIVAISFF
jgi:hypothetical protein